MQDPICPRTISLGSLFGFGTNTRNVPVVAEPSDPNRADHEPQKLLEGDKDL